MTVYFIRAGDGPVKIGVAANVRQRICMSDRQIYACALVCSLSMAAPIVLFTVAVLLFR